jgi:NhaA family Na+:H+ antiporter
VKEDLGRLPRVPMDRFSKPFGRFLRIEAAAGAVLLLCTACALALSNSAWSETFLAFWETPVGLRVGDLQFSRTLRHWINDGLMTFFFFVVALELKREVVLGELRDLRMGALSFAAALGGMALPAGLYLTLVSGDADAHGWGTVMATDTAFVIGCLAILGRRIPHSLRLFLLSLAIFDDIGAILVVAVGYGGPLNWWLLALAMIGLALVLVQARLGVRNIPVYALIGGLIWLAFDASGIHPTLAGVTLGLMTPARGWVSDNRLRAILDRVVAHPLGDRWAGDTKGRTDLRRAGVAIREAVSPVERLEIALHPWVAFVFMPLFALANAGVQIRFADLEGAVPAAVFIGFVIGKPLGVLLFSVLAVRLRLAVRPPSLSWGVLAAGGLLTGIGFTMALFIAQLAFSAAHLNAAKLGIFGASVVSGISGLVVLTLLTSRSGGALERE